MNMIDTEVERLRRLRGMALRVRAVSRRLNAPRKIGRHVGHCKLLSLVACASWRVTRIVSGHLRAHPYANFQKDAGLGTLLLNGVVATAASLKSTEALTSLRLVHSELKELSRQLADARSLTRTPTLSDVFGRSQSEIRALLNAVERNAYGVATTHERSVNVPGGGDWPYLAF